MWVWLGDHNIDGDGSTQISVFSGRGILSESRGPVWMIGTASEHHALYQYSLINAKEHWMGLIQTETVIVLHPFQHTDLTVRAALLSACPATPVSL